MNLAAILRTTARRHPDAPAFVEDGQSLSYGRLHACAEAAAQHLHRLGVRTGDLVVIAVRSVALNSILLFAASRIGVIACNLDWRARPAERKAILAALGPRLMLVDRPLQSDDGVASAMVDPGWQSMPANSIDLEPVDDPSLPALLLLSSGTTGEPKAMVVTQAAALWRAAIRAAESDIKPGCRFLMPVGLTASAAVHAMLGQVFAGAVSYQVPAIFAPEELLQALQRHRIEQATLVPTVIRWMLEHAPQRGVLLPDIAELRAFGAAFAPDDKRAVMERITPNLFEGYGSAGAGGITRATPSDIVERPTSVGRAQRGMSVDIVDDQDRRLPTGSIGRVRVRSLGNAIGYHGETGRDERNEIFRNGCTYPGDLGRLDDDGYLYLEGRAASLIIRGGQNIYPEEIERVLNSHPAVLEAAVIGVPDAGLGEVPVALLVADAGISAPELLAHCHRNLVSYKVPAALHVVAELPKNATGKIARARLAELLPGAAAS